MMQIGHLTMLRTPARRAWTASRFALRVPNFLMENHFRRTT